jgi:AcrR family transcriptional regulator
MNSTELSRKDRKKEHRRQTLIDAATLLFTKHGYSGTTIDDIVLEADVAKVTFYSYFKSKEEIALEIKRKGTEEALAYVESLRAQQLPVNEMIEKLCVDVAEWTEKNFRLLDVFCNQRFSPLMERESVSSCKPEPMTICLDYIIQRGQETGVYRKDIDRCRIAHLLDLAILCEQYHWVRTGRPKGELKKHLQGYFDFALNGLELRK